MCSATPYRGHTGNSATSLLASAYSIHHSIPTEAHENTHTSPLALYPRAESAKPTLPKGHWKHTPPPGVIRVPGGKWHMGDWGKSAKVPRRYEWGGEGEVDVDAKYVVVRRRRRINRKALIWVGWEGGWMYGKRWRLTRIMYGWNRIGEDWEKWMGKEKRRSWRRYDEKRRKMLTTNEKNKKVREEKKVMGNASELKFLSVKYWWNK